MMCRQEAFGQRSLRAKKPSAKKPSGTRSPRAQEAFGHKKPSGKEGRVPRREKRRKR
ncbi:hypothetical protein CASFOL_013985 [Castilleja foliolosa]|uniref:Uncharacterized protein n=1 Tax=Castilleja foliolosa TaxID=1961234 RepID=A0ABD3DLK1_9LAMI